MTPLQTITVLKKTRESKKLSQQQLSELTGINQRAISRLETGVYFPNLTTLSKLCKALELTIEVK